jgi:membrane protein implicated in regulation of membrane protease activity
MEEWVWWMIAAGVLAVGEIFTMGFFLGPIAIAAVLASIVSLVGGGLAASWIVFIVASLASLAVLRPIARRHLRTPARIRTGTAALVGAPATVVERVDANGGCVKIGGEIWTARAYDEDDSFEPGARVEVMKIDGATALVAE